MRDLLPLILLFLFGAFAVLSAVLKSRARVTALLGVALAVLEGISGLVLMVVSLPGSGSLEAASRLGLVTAVLVAVSSTVHLLKVRDGSRTREASEGKRLYAAVQPQLGERPSETEDGPPGPDAPIGMQDDSDRPEGTHS